MIKQSGFNEFTQRHIGIDKEALTEMLVPLNIGTLDELIDETIPRHIRLKDVFNLPEAQTEYDYLKHIRTIANKNHSYTSYIGLGFYNTITPSVILRNIFQNPGWYTQYTPYQAEISQGRLEALFNFQTLVSDLTGLPIANASLLDEATAAAEAMLMFYHAKNKRHKGDAINEFFVDNNVFPYTLEVLETRAQPLGIKIVKGDWTTYVPTANAFGVFLQYPNSIGRVVDYKNFTQLLGEKGIYVTVAADLLSLALLTPPGEWGADAVVGNTQRFGVPLGYGGPHAGYFATKDAFKRQIPGRIIGLSMDVHENPAYRMALQTREQHIRREKATSNICTAQALLAVMAGMYAVYHGPKRLKNIAERIHQYTQLLAKNIQKLNYTISTIHFFDTINIVVNNNEKESIQQLALAAKINFYYNNDSIQISLDETTSLTAIQTIVSIFAKAKNNTTTFDDQVTDIYSFPEILVRKSPYLTHPVFNTYRTETEMMRYVKSLENKDLSLMHAMIPLGSCTMKLNAATQLIPVSWAAFADVHPFVPEEQTAGYQQLFEELENYLCEITGLSACSLQPNSGAQGEFAGLMTIRAYHEANGNKHRNIALIPASAHGTNPASAVMAGMKVIVVKTDEKGNIAIDDLRQKVAQYKDTLAAFMVTYPSTHGVFEANIQEVCQIIHDAGGKVYLDGANMNAQVGLTNPGIIGADVCHLNLHKTFSIPHGGGGPGMGPICVNDSLAPYLPKHSMVKTGGQNGIPAVSAAPWGSASILLISYAYIRLLGKKGLTNASRYAILNANYIKSRLENDFDILYTGEKGRAAHELIVDLRPFKALVSAEDVAKRLIDYGFHAPTLSFPVAGTIMIEPTESESKEEIDRFCEAMLQIRREIEEIVTGIADLKSNVLKNAPCTLQLATADEWPYAYTREKAVYPLPYLKSGHKFWASVSRVNNAFGDRNLICTCPPIESYQLEIG